ncbi:hypothetical protein Gotur_023595, partial [Gossypium turneri]
LWIVLDVFIPQKLSRSGRRFGFVRSADNDDTKRAICHLNGFTFHGNRLGVNMARFKGRSSYWRKLRCKVPRDAVTRLEENIGESEASQK